MKKIDIKDYQRDKVYVLICNDKHQLKKSGMARRPCRILNRFGHDVTVAFVKNKKKDIRRQTAILRGDWYDYYEL